jgi:molybdopterin-guanine dinucleotide biosynthesis protein A
MRGMQASAIILAGGTSRRMGKSKARLMIGGVSMLERVARTAGTVCDETIVAGRMEDAEKWPQLDAKWVDDPPDVAGPVAGLIAGLRVARNDICLVVACDMPFLNPELLEHLLAASVGHDAAVPRIDSRAQTLHAAFTRSCLQRLETLVVSKSPSMESILEGLDVHCVDETTCRSIDPTGLSCFNVNTPDDLERAREVASWRLSAQGSATETGVKGG